MIYLSLVLRKLEASTEVRFMHTRALTQSQALVFGFRYRGEGCGLKKASGLVADRAAYPHQIDNHRYSVRLADLRLHTKVRSTAFASEQSEVFPSLQLPYARDSPYSRIAPGS
ncbi:hypothetical protein RRG08_009130 [Elysia crispata]|uniref:Uncharacterized protein n=1 Tax=Elysia crispata TaxID=231223 RepID=A0AAE0YNT7_9GAST|nr:hypothetical protein RRG08_009130 [Elysia crispata]